MSMLAEASGAERRLLVETRGKVRKMLLKAGERGDPVPESLATLSCEVIQKIRNTSNELSDLAKEISRQNTESAICLLHATYDKT